MSGLELAHGRSNRGALPNVKMNDPIERNEPLGRALREWKVAPSLPPRFQEEVWRRIGWAEVHRASFWWSDVRHGIEVSFRRPALAVSYVAALLLIGLGLGMAQGRHASARMDETLGTRYLHSIDPYLAPRPDR